MRVNREEVLWRLEAVSPGLSPGAVIEQSDCFVLRSGRVDTFNDEVACSIDLDLGVTGAVRAKPLLDLLGKLPDQEIVVEQGEGELVVKGRRCRAGICMEREVVLPRLEQQPGQWRDVPDRLVEALGVAHECASSDESRFLLTCVHLHPHHVEACDNYRIVRFPMETGLEKPVLVRRRSVEHIVGMNALSWGETGEWVCLRNADGLRLDCRRWEENYPELDRFLLFKGAQVSLPDDLGDAVARAQIFSGEAAGGGDDVLVRLRPGEMRLEGHGPSGRYQEDVPVKYEGEPLSFRISPKLLVGIAKYGSECEVGEGRIKVATERFTYVCSTEVPDGGE